VNDHMKPSTLFFVLLAPVGLALTALAADYGSLINQGYRWVTVNGPYAYPSKEDPRTAARVGSQNPSNRLFMPTT
jgi:hypothetical protein